MHTKNPAIFIHYSWDSERHKEWVLFLANRLVADGIDVVLDRLDLKISSNNIYFMEKVEKVDKVVLIMTEEYKKKANERKGGLGYEYQIISSEIQMIGPNNCDKSNIVAAINTVLNKDWITVNSFDESDVYCKRRTEILKLKNQNWLSHCNVASWLLFRPIIVMVVGKGKISVKSKGLTF